jgi:AbrB family looped-hinge helix DNA binding protein
MEEIYRTKINNEGKIVIPAPCRKRLGIQSGQEVILRLEPDGLHLVRLSQVMKHFQSKVQTALGTEASLPNKLFRERRDDARNE